MKNLLRFLAAHPLVWLVPLLLFVLVLGALAWKIAHTPDSPFVYRI